MSKPLVSVCIVTYQHARFIAQALEGALMQRTDFPVEILMGEDESSDGTREICLDYARRHPDKIRVFLRHRRDVVLIDGKPRGSYNFRMTLREAKGEFVALCEGDDFWTDPEKLQRQVDYLRANPGCVGCFHDAKLVDAENNVLKPSYFRSEKRQFDRHAAIETLMSSYPTCSLLFRRAAFDPLPAWFLRRPCDLYLDIHLTGSGTLDFLDRNMAAYRKHAAGIWSGQREANQVIELIVRYKLLLADEFFLTHHREVLLRKIDEFQALLFTRADAAGELSRLEKIVLEQTSAVTTAEEHRSGLQHSIDGLRRQIDELAATAKEQLDFIAVLQNEKKRLEAELGAERKSMQRERENTGTQLAGLVKQLEVLAATCKTQTDYIAVLEAERGRLTSELAAVASLRDEAAALARQQIDALTVESKRYIAVIEEQQTYIKKLEDERDRINTGGR